MPAPNFEDAKGGNWEKMTRQAMQAGTLDRFPRKPRKTAAEHDFWGQVDRRLSRTSFMSPGISFDKDGNVIREETA